MVLPNKWYQSLWFDKPLNGLRITLRDVMHGLKLKVEHIWCHMKQERYG